MTENLEGKEDIIERRKTQREQHKEKRNNTKMHMRGWREKRKIAKKYKREKERKSVEKS